ncbi:ArsR/SmtB family transcription factor [Streptomyces sp. NPDC057623]|uniref:ArsR/SmtB family transcription factor n=1 Tax=Streptomyces sp. NPDC057623 TaxID=3346187 RepID=UPI00367D7BA9
MIRLTVDDASLSTVRLTFSPLWEIIGSLGILARYRGAAPSPYTDWARRVRDRLPADLVRMLVEPLRRPDPRPFPAGFVPIPDPARNTLAAELDHIREASVGDPEAERLVPLLEEYWDRAIAPHWNSVRASLEEEILFRGRTLAVEGAEPMLTELGGRVAWARPVLTAPYHRDLDVTLSRSKLLLVPTVFAGGIRLFLEERGVVAMSYQARATGYFHVLTAREHTPQAEDRLALLLGKGRAQVVRALDAPRTTTAVAEALGMAKSTVSQHLAVLNDTGIVWKQRLGGRVFYQLDQSGLALLRQLGL